MTLMEMGIKKMAALMCHMDSTMFDPELWFSDGKVVEQIDIPLAIMKSGEKFSRSCSGLFLVQFGKQKLVQLVYTEDWYTHMICSSYQYVYEDGTLINISEPNKVLLFLNDKDMNAVVQKSSYLYLHNNMFSLGTDIDEKFFESLFGTHTYDSNIYGGVCYDEYFVYYKDRKFHEFSAEKMDIEVVKAMYANFGVCRTEIEEAFKNIVFSHAPAYDDQNCRYKSSELKSIYKSENDKLFLNYEISGSVVSGGSNI